MDASDPGASTEDVLGVVKEHISLVTFSERFGTTLEVGMREPRPRFFVLGPSLSFL